MPPDAVAKPSVLNPDIDVLLLAADWRARALIRAQLLEEGFEIVATDTWSMMRGHLRPGVMPRLLIIDLKALEDPRRVLEIVGLLTPPDRVLVLRAIGTIAPAELQRLGFHVLSRPFAIRDVVNTVAGILRSGGKNH